MIVGTEFPGDDNKTLMDVQHALYWELLRWLLVAPRDRYLSASCLLRMENDLSQQLRTMTGFDHRTLQAAHDIIAAYFRFSWPDSAQLLLDEQEDAYRLRLGDAWRNFFKEEVKALTTDDEFTRAICTATAFGNKEAGLAAEAWVEQYLKERYADRGFPRLRNPA
jgi:hypothetical protein